MKASRILSLFRVPKRKMKFFASILINTIAVFVAAYLFSGVKVASLLVCFLAALILGLINSFIKPFLKILTLPLNVLTLGLFSLFINALIILLVSNLVSGFYVDSFLTAFLFSITLLIVSSLLGFLV